MKTQERVLMKSCKVLALLTAIAAMAAPALAAPTTLYSGQTGVISYLSDDGTKTMYVNILYAVYDTSTGAYDGAPGPQRYVYVYVVQSQSNSEIAVDLFSVIAPLGSIAGVGTSSSYGDVDAVASIGGTPGVNDAANFAFSIAGMSLDPGKQSYLLMITSDYEYKKDGQAVIRGGSGATNNELPRPEVPEPLTAAMLALGGLAILRNKAAKKQ